MQRRGKESAIRNAEAAEIKTVGRPMYVLTTTQKKLRVFDGGSSDSEEE